MSHRDHAHLPDLEAAIDKIRSSPRDAGTLDRVVARTAIGERQELESGHLDLVVGLVGDTWSKKPSKRTPDGSPNPEQQITLMNVRAALALGDRWTLAGDNLYVDFDLSPSNVPPGTRLVVGTAVLEVTAMPHTGCDKFTERFGSDATKWVNSGAGRELNLRGIHAKVITAGAIRRGDAIRKT